MKIVQNSKIEEPASPEDKRKHLEFIQQVITRMGGNLFYLRGWSITLIGGLLALLSQIQQPDSDKFPLYMLAAVIAVFWVYDGYFLSLERKYRDLYNKVRQQSVGEINYSLDVREFSGEKKNSLVFCMLSKTLAPFYVLFLLASAYLIFRTV